VSTTLTSSDPQAQPESSARPRQVARSVAISVLLLALLIVGFVGYLLGVSGIQEASAQRRLYPTLANELGQDIGPLGPTRPGMPVAVLEIPKIGISNLVVVEGTSPENMTAGPGHLRNTPLPGQLGMSVIYGRRVTFGAPFARLGDLLPGDEIVAITQQGRSVYKVAAIGDSQHPVVDQNLNRLVLLTSSSANVPSYYLEVDADLVTTAHNGPVQMPAIGPSEKALAGDSNALVLTMIWGLALAIVAMSAAVASARWSAWLVYLVITPAVLATVWNLYENLAALLPNLY
jgi:LPXTG-site transpeptidase (sortase) family protein